MPTPSSFTEAELCSLLQGHDRNAFSYLYDRYSGALLAEILRIVKMHESAEHILQETFILVYRQTNQYDSSKGRLFTWLITIARNKSIDFLRSAQTKYAKRTGDLKDDLIVSDFGHTESNTEYYFLQRRLQATIVIPTSHSGSSASQSCQ